MSSSAKLWTNDFIKMCIGNFLLFVSLYMLLPLFPAFLVEKFGISFFTAGWILALFAVSLFILGPFYNYLVDTYKRMSVYLLSALAVVAILGGYPLVTGIIWIIVLRILQGMFSGLTVMTIGSTLAIDITASSRRSEANTSVARFGRAGMAFGPMVGLLVYQYYGFDTVFLTSAVVSVLAMLLVSTVHVTFRAPIGSPLCSTDRFILGRGWVLALNLVLITSVLGLILVTIDSYFFYFLMAVGVMVAMLANSLVFAEADVRARIISGLILMGAALLLLTTHVEEAAFATSALLMGTGLGLASFHFLLMLIKLTEHCQRGTANTTYAFAWEVGVALGMFAGCAMKENCDSTAIFHTGVWLTVSALLFYIGLANPYFIKHKIR